MSDDTTLQMDRRQVLLSTAGAASLLMLSSQTGTAAATDKQATGRMLPFDLGWRFYRGEGNGFEAAAFDDSSWRTVDVPHDWSMEDLPPQSGDGKSDIVGPFDPKAIGEVSTGFTVGGEGWYRKRFQLQAPANGRVEIVFEGVYMNSDVWLNGRHLGNHPYGYTPFAYDLTPHLAADGNNVLAVRARNVGKNSRWYAGSGIYRHVWLDVLAEPARIARWGVGVVTRRIVDGSADIEISTQLQEVSDGLILVSRIRDDRGRVVKELSAPAAATHQQSLSIAAPRLWSPDKPTLYTLETELRRGKLVLDRAVNEFGMRIVTFDVNQGMTINGVLTKLRGGCIHHDNGLLGACSFDAAEERKVKLLKARGYNAVRPSHNPFSAAFLRACDRHGLLVIAETFDAWQVGKLPEDYAVYFDQQWQRDLSTIVLSARNHPSIIMWSIGNEIPGRNTPAGVEVQWQLANHVHRLDPTRAVTAAINCFAGRPVTPTAPSSRVGYEGVPDRTSVLFLDVVGYNYKLNDYAADHQLFPKRIFYGAESFAKDMAAIWQLTNKTPWLIGDFVWTAMDYWGEAGIGGSAFLTETEAANPMSLSSGWPWVNAFCGDIDLIGQQKAPSLARDVTWGISPLEIAVQRPVPDGKVESVRLWGWSDEHRSWTWPDAKGKTLAVRIYTIGDRVELRLNGRTLDSKAVTAADLQRIEFSVPYQPGVLEAIAFRAGKEIARKRLTTVGAAVAIRLTHEGAKGGIARGEINYVRVDIVDAQGRVVPDTVKQVQLVIAGAAELLAFGSANPLAVGSIQAPHAQTYDGHALAILRSKSRIGRVTIEASGAGLRSGSIMMRLA